MQDRELSEVDRLRDASVAERSVAPEAYLACSGFALAYTLETS